MVIIFWWYIHNIVYCQSLNDIDNGNITCILGDDEIPSYEDICHIKCNPGYTLTGSGTRMCLRNGSWNGVDSSCRLQGKILSYVAK